MLKPCLRCNGKGRIIQTIHIDATGTPCLKTDAGAIESKVDRGTCRGCGGRKFLKPEDYARVGAEMQKERSDWAASRGAWRTEPATGSEPNPTTATDDPLRTKDTVF